MRLPELPTALLLWACAGCSTPEEPPALPDFSALHASRGVVTLADGREVPYVLVTSDAKREEGERALRTWVRAHDRLKELDAADWDGDEVPDVLVHCAESGTLLAVPGAPFVLRARTTSVFSIVDDDGDGCPDLMIGTDDCVVLVHTSDGGVRVLPR